MSRPTLGDVAAGLESWDSLVRDNFTALTTGGALPVKEYASFAALPAAGNFDRCIAALTDEKILVISDGAAWQRVPALGSGVKMLTGTGSPETVITAPVGSIWLRTNGGAGTTMYIKESGAGNTGWRAV